MNSRAPLLAAVFAALTVACAGSTGSPGAEPVSATIDASGGSLVVGGAKLTIPAGALATAQTITMAVASDATPAGYEAYSPLFRFGPEGLTFAKPVTVSIPFTPPAGSAKIAVYWSRSGSSGYDPLAATIAGSVATVDVTHFSEGFVAKGADSDSCPAPQKRCSGSCVDLLEEDANCGECGRVCAKGNGCFAGVCKSLAQWAQWPVPPDSPTQYSCSSDTVLDQVTGLTWQRNPPDQAYLWAEAVDYCSGLGLEGPLAWRMPTRIELLSIVDLTRAGPAINIEAFPEMKSEKYWAHTASPIVSTSRYYVNFGDGVCDSTVSDLQTTRQRVRCVR